MADPLWMQLLKEQPGRAEKERGQGAPGGGPPSSFGVMQPQYGPPPGPSPDDARLAPDQFDELMRGVWRMRDVFILPFTVGVVPIMLRPAESRRYLFLQNQSGAVNIALGINGPPGPVASVPVAGLIIATNFGFYEPLVIPQGEIWVVGGAAATPGVLLYSA